MGAVILGWFAVGLLLYYVPHLLAYWAHLGTPLSLTQRLLVALSQLVDHNLLLLLPTLLGGTAVVFWWRLRAIRRAHRARATRIGQ
jgi:type II secretory pathway component PulF